MSPEIQRQGEWTPVDPRDNAQRDAQRLLGRLGRLGLRLTEQYKVTARKYDIGVSMQIVEIPHATLYPFILYPYDNKELIQDSTDVWKYNSFYFIDANMKLNTQPFSMHIDVEPKRYEPYKLSLVMATHIPQEKEVSLGLLPLNFSSVGFRYDFIRNPEHRERISEFSEKRVDMDMVNGDPLKPSGIFGRQTPNGIDVVSILHLQTPNHSRYLKCYEVELFGTEVGLGRKRFLHNTKEIVPESDYQEKERHFCMTGDKETLTYPLFPIKLDKISRLAMEISYHGDTPQVMFDLLGDLPLSIDGINQWYAPGGNSLNGRFEMLFKPEWGKNNTALVYHQFSPKRISPEQIHSAVVGLSTLKKDLTERLAA